MKGSLYYRSLKKETVEAAADLAEDQEYIREQLDPMGLCAFVADGAILPRESGVSGRPMPLLVTTLTSRKKLWYV